MKIYVFKQLFCISMLFLIAIIVDYCIQTLSIENIVLKQAMMFITISMILFFCNQLIYNYAKIAKEFMQHKIWKKMFIIILVWLMISFIVFISLFFTTPLGDIILLYPWIMLIIGYYFLFVINFFILSIVHNIVDMSMKLEKKILITWGSSSLLVAVVFFLLPLSSY